jgi:hypothetical protein
MAILFMVEKEMASKNNGLNYHSTEKNKTSLLNGAF